MQIQEEGTARYHWDNVVGRFSLHAQQRWDQYRKMALAPLPSMLLVNSEGSLSLSEANSYIYPVSYSLGHTAWMSQHCIEDKKAVCGLGEDLQHLEMPLLLPYSL